MLFRWTNALTFFIITLQCPCTTSIPNAQSNKQLMTEGDPLTQLHGHCLQQSVLAPSQRKDEQLLPFCYPSRSSMFCYKNESVGRHGNNMIQDSGERPFTNFSCKDKQLHYRSKNEWILVDHYGLLPKSLLTKWMNKPQLQLKNKYKLYFANTTNCMQHIILTPKPLPLGLPKALQLHKREHRHKRYLQSNFTILTTDTTRINVQLSYKQNVSTATPVALKLTKARSIKREHNIDVNINVLVVVAAVFVIFGVVFPRFFKKETQSTSLPPHFDCRLNKLSYGVRKLIIQKLNLDKSEIKTFLDAVFDEHTLQNYRLDKNCLHLDLATDFEMAFIHIETKLPYYRVSELIPVLHKLQKYAIVDIIITTLTKPATATATTSQQQQQQQKQQQQKQQQQKRKSMIQWSAPSNSNDETFV